VKDKLLIIGSDGFIGSHMLSFFHSRNADVYGCDIIKYTDKKNYFYINKCAPEFETIFSTNKFDYCINCSGAANVPFSVTNPLDDFLLNTKNVLLILEAIRKHNSSCRFINLSSAAVYGNPKFLPVKEEAEINPVSPYGVHKELAEKICSEYTNFFGVPTCNLRIFSAFGPGLRKQIFWDLYNKSKQPGIELFGTGNETRDFIYIDDIVQVVSLVVEKAAFKGEAYNVANGVQIKIKDLAQLFLRKLAYNRAIKFTGSKREGDPDLWQADIKKIKKFGYQQSISFETGVNNYIEWLKERD
jgi:UDP-glucose 4-epimerase